MQSHSERDATVKRVFGAIRRLGLTVSTTLICGQFCLQLRPVDVFSNVPAESKQQLLKSSCQLRNDKFKKMEPKRIKSLLTASKVRISEKAKIRIGSKLLKCQQLLMQETI
jgi:hypothetical protein